MLRCLKLNSVLFLYYLLIAFPLFYFVYKYSTPYGGMIDFFDYYKLYESMDIHAADSPLNMRLLSSFFVYVLNKTGLVYNTITQIDNAPFQKSIYFNAVFLNYLWVVLTCIMIYHLARKRGQSVLLSLFMGTLYILGFGTIFFELMPLADAMAVFLFTVFLWYYYRKSSWVVIPLFLLIFQREYLLLAIILLSFLDFWKTKDRYFLYNVVLSCLFFGLYVLLRKLYFETPRYAHHTSGTFMMNAIIKNHFPLLPFVRQTVMTLNISLIYLGVILYKKVNGLSFQKYEFYKITLLFAQIVVLAVLLGLGNNTGRYYYMVLPLVLLIIGDEVMGLLGSSEK